MRGFKNAPLMGKIYAYIAGDLNSLLSLRNEKNELIPYKGKKEIIQGLKNYVETNDSKPFLDAYSTLAEAALEEELLDALKNTIEQADGVLSYFQNIIKDDNLIDEENPLHEGITVIDIPDVSETLHTFVRQLIWFRLLMAVNDKELTEEEVSIEWLQKRLVEFLAIPEPCSTQGLPVLFSPQLRKVYLKNLSWQDMWDRTYVARFVFCLFLTATIIVGGVFNYIKYTAKSDVSPTPGLNGAPSPGDPSPTVEEPLLYTNIKLLLVFLMLVLYVVRPAVWEVLEPLVITGRDRTVSLDNQAVKNLYNALPPDTRAALEQASDKPKQRPKAD